MSSLLSGRHWGGNWDQLCELSEVLSRGSEEELVLSTRRTSQPEPVEAQDALEMREQHGRLLPNEGMSEILPKGREKTSLPGRWRW